ncbi:MAG: ABC transporter permease [Pseudomonadales bacterium]|nr:ABC transporter permease [Pseudomonadales bacterium]MBO6566460.1 ABC transporter permease [Pseudomonadales bacterium]
MARCPASIDLPFMRDYLIRRFLLIVPTLIGVTIIVFAITRLVPGGPLERAIMESQQFSAAGASSQVAGADMALSEAQLDKLKEYYGLDKPVLESYVEWLGKVVQGDLGESYRYNEPVWDVIRDRMPVSLYYGLVTLVITYMVCIPLGVLKAIRHRTFVDNVTSILIFVGYAIPGYALGSLLLLYFSVRLEWFPMGGFVSLQFYDKDVLGKTLDLISHSVLPLICYLIGSFALVTLLLKNHLMDNLAADYIRTAIAKGVSFRRAVTGHALRNSLIPIATTFGQNIVLLVSGSFLIETIFDIDGFGLLGLTAILDRDYPVVMGVVLLSSLLLLIGNIISDILVALVDPRIRFQ